MTVYFAATERLDWETQHGTVNSSSTSGRFNSSNGRAYIGIIGTSTDDLNYADAVMSSAATDFWLHFVLYHPSLSTNLKFVKFYSSGTLKLGIAEISVTSYGVYQWNGSSWTLLLTVDLSPVTASFNGDITPWDLHIKVGNPGTIACYYNGVPVGITTSVDLSGVSNIDTIRFQPSNSTDSSGLSEVIVASWNTIGSKIVSVAPTGNGANTAWANDYTNVDEAGDGGTDYITSGTVNQRETYTFSAFPSLASGESIAAVGVGIEAFRDASSPQSINMCTRISGTDYDGADRSLNTSLTYLQKIWEVSPATSAAWTLTEANGAEFGVRSRT